MRENELSQRPPGRPQTEGSTHYVEDNIYHFGAPINSTSRGKFGKLRCPIKTRKGERDDRHVSEADRPRRKRYYRSRSEPAEWNQLDAGKTRYLEFCRRGEFLLSSSGF